MNYGIILPGTLVYNMGVYAGKMVDAARAGQPLNDYRSAENSNYFLQAPTNDIGAYLKSAYWLAVGARLIGNSTLLSAAEWNFAKGTALAALPLTSQLSSSVVSILQEAARVLNSYAQNRNIAAVVGALGYQASAGAQAEMQQVRSDQRVWYNTAVATATDIADGATLAKALVTGKKPPGKTDWEWWWQRNKWYAGGAIAAVGVLGYVFRPYVQAYNKKGGE